MASRDNLLVGIQGTQVFYYVHGCFTIYMGIHSQPYIDCAVYILQTNLQASQISIFSTPIKYSNIGGTTDWFVCGVWVVLRGFTSWFPIFDVTDAHCVAMKNC